MLKFEVTEQPDAIEQYFCKPLDGVRVKPLSVEESGILIKLLFSEEEGFKKFVYDNTEGIPFLFQLITKRLQAFDYTMDTRCIMFIALIAGSPGKAVMYLTYIQYKCKIKGIQKLSLELLADLFPNGFYSDLDLNTLWDKQKVDRNGLMVSDNLLDYPEAMKSIRF